MFPLLSLPSSIPTGGKAADGGHCWLFPPPAEGGHPAGEQAVLLPMCTCASSALPSRATGQLCGVATLSYHLVSLESTVPTVLVLVLLSSVNWEVQGAECPRAPSVSEAGPRANSEPLSEALFSISC